MFNNFLVPFDGSPSAFHAVNTALEGIPIGSRALKIPGFTARM